MMVGLSREDAICCSMWIVGYNLIAAGEFSHAYLLGILPDFKHWFLFVHSY